MSMLKRFEIEEWAEGLDVEIKLAAGRDRRGEHTHTNCLIQTDSLHPLIATDHKTALPQSQARLILRLIDRRICY